MIYGSDPQKMDHAQSSDMARFICESVVDPSMALTAKVVNAMVYDQMRKIFDPELRNVES